MKVITGERPPRPVLEMPSDFLWALVEDCWKQHPSHRPGMEVVVKKLIPLSDENSKGRNPIESRTGTA